MQSKTHWGKFLDFEYADYFVSQSANEQAIQYALDRRLIETGKYVIYFAHLKCKVILSDAGRSRGSP